MACCSWSLSVLILASGRDGSPRVSSGVGAVSTAGGVLGCWERASSWSAGDGGGAEALQGVGDGLGPGCPLREVEQEAWAGAGEGGGDGEQPEPEPFGFPPAGLVLVKSCRGRLVRPVSWRCGSGPRRGPGGGAAAPGRAAARSWCWWRMR